MRYQWPYQQSNPDTATLHVDIKLESLGGNEDMSLEDRLKEIRGVTGVVVNPYSVVVTKASLISWDMIKPRIVALISWDMIKPRIVALISAIYDPEGGPPQIQM